MSIRRRYVENKRKMIKFAGVAHHGTDGVNGENIGTYLTSKEPNHVEKYKSLYDKGYLVSQKDSDLVNMVTMSYSDLEFLETLPKMSVKTSIKNSMKRYTRLTKLNIQKDFITSAELLIEIY